MSTRMEPKIKFLTIAAAVIIVGAVIAVVATSMSSGPSGVPRMELETQYYDFGTVSMADGNVSHKFSIKNEGDGNLKLSTISTSCMCTTAILEVDNSKSPVFGMHNNPTLWSEEVKPGQEAFLEVVFDPNAHGPNAVGPITRTITMYSNDQGKQSVKSTFTITANVVK